MELYKYTGSVAALTVRFGKAETITLYDSYDDSVAPVRLDVRGALAEYIKEIESTDSEERYNLPDTPENREKILKDFDCWWTGWTKPIL